MGGPNVLVRGANPQVLIDHCSSSVVRMALEVVKGLPCHVYVSGRGSKGAEAPPPLRAVASVSPLRLRLGDAMRWQEDWIHEEAYGFCTGRSATDAAGLLETLLGLARATGRTPTPDPFDDPMGEHPSSHAAPVKPSGHVPPVGIVPTVNASVQPPAPTEAPTAAPLVIEDSPTSSSDPEKQIKVPTSPGKGTATEEWTEVAGLLPGTDVYVIRSANMLKCTIQCNDVQQVPNEMQQIGYWVTTKGTEPWFVQLSMVHLSQQAADVTLRTTVKRGGCSTLIGPINRRLRSHSHTGSTQKGTPY